MATTVRSTPQFLLTCFLAMVLSLGVSGCSSEPDPTLENTGFDALIKRAQYQKCLEDWRSLKNVEGGQSFSDSQIIGLCTDALIRDSLPPLTLPEGRFTAEITEE
jgi:hypothetical protein